MLAKTKRKPGNREQRQRTSPRTFDSRLLLLGMDHEQPTATTSGEAGWPSPVGLCTGIGAVIVGQIFTLAYYWLLCNGALGKPVRIQDAKRSDEGGWSWARVGEHLMQPEGFLLLGGYLSGTWMFRWMPASYYSFEGGVRWDHVLVQLLLTDLLQYLMHLGEHKISPQIYKLSHKPHHVYTSPRLTDAFSGSPSDTILMILVPLFATAQLVHCNVW